MKGFGRGRGDTLLPKRYPPERGIFYVLTRRKQQNDKKVVGDRDIRHGQCYGIGDDEEISHLDAKRGTSGERGGGDTEILCALL